jgi:hypothetical protein
VEVIVAFHIDRLTRKLADLEDLIELCEARGVRIATVSGDVDLSTDSGRLVGRILASVAKGEVERKGARQKAANDQRARAGRPPDRRAFGYRQDGTIHPVEGPAVAEVFARFVAGGSITAITRWLNAEGHRTTTGREWDRTSVRWMLGNARYCRIRMYRGEEIGAGRWDPIVSEDVLRASQAILADPARHERLPSTARKWLGSRMYLCGRCADGATVAVSYGRTGYRQYRCQRCYMVRAAAPVDELVEAVIAARLRRADLADLLAETAPDVEPLRSEARALRTRIDALAADIEIDERTLAARDRALRKRLGEVEHALGEAGRSSVLARVAGAPDPGLAWLELDDVVARQEVVRTLATVTLLQVPRGTRTFDPATVKIAWRTP